MYYLFLPVIFADPSGLRFHRNRLFPPADELDPPPPQFSSVSGGAPGPERDPLLSSSAVNALSRSRPILLMHSDIALYVPRRSLFHYYKIPHLPHALLPLPCWKS